MVKINSPISGVTIDFVQLRLPFVEGGQVLSLLVRDQQGLVFKINNPSSRVEIIMPAETQVLGDGTVINLVEKSIILVGGGVSGALAFIDTTDTLRADSFNCGRVSGSNIQNAACSIAGTYGRTMATGLGSPARSFRNKTIKVIIDDNEMFNLNLTTPTGSISVEPIVTQKVVTMPSGEMVTVPSVTTLVEGGVMRFSPLLTGLLVAGGTAFGLLFFFGRKKKKQEVK